MKEQYHLILKLFNKTLYEQTKCNQVGEEIGLLLKQEGAALHGQLAHNIH